MKVKISDGEGISKKIGAILRASRKSAGISSKKICDYLQITAQQYSKYERGDNDISVLKLYLICKKFGLYLNFAGIEENKNIFQTRG